MFGSALRKVNKLAGGEDVKQFTFQIAGLLVLVFGGMWLTFNPSIWGGSPLAVKNQGAKPNTTDKRIEIVSNDGKTIKSTLSIEVADTPDKRGVGLGGRNTLKANAGMLFVFSQPGNYEFWMKNMKIPIDMIWISSDEIVDITEDVPPPAAGETELPLYKSAQPVDKVLEVNSGYAKDHNISPGDKIRQLN